MKKFFKKTKDFLKKQSFKKFWLPIIISSAVLVAAIVTVAVLLSNGKNCKHQAIVDAAVPATCTEEGLTAGEHCSKCGETLEGREKIPALGHEEEEHAGKEPTCTEAGNKPYVSCKRCSYTTYQEAAALGHDLEQHEGKEATTEENGYKPYETCKRCDYTTYELIFAIGHTPSEFIVKKQPTCTEEGVKNIVCTDCGKILLTEKIDPLGHDIIFHEGKEPTEEENGYKAYETCQRCNYTTFEWRFATNHTPGEWIIDKEAACTEDGKRHINCSGCGKLLAEEVLFALGHATVEHEEKPVTCVEDGHPAYETCERCDYTTYEKIPAKGHEYTITKTDEAYHWKECFCGESDVKEEHTYSEWFSFTIIEINSEAYTRCCAVCGRVEYKLEGESDSYSPDKFEEYIADKLPEGGLDTLHIHKNIESLEGKEATCTEPGIAYSIKCKDCGEIIYVKETEPLGHDLEQHEGKAPTADTDGWSPYETCKREGCDYTTYNPLPAYGHTVVIDRRVEPTCTETGLTEGSHCSVCGKVFVAQRVIDALGHTYEKESDETHHWDECFCGDKGEREEHQFTEWFGFEIAELEITSYTRCCVVCKRIEYKDEGGSDIYDPDEFNDFLEEEAGSPLPSVHIHKNLKTLDGIDPTCEQDGSEYRIKCLDCGEIIYEKFLSRLGHDMQPVTSNHPCIEIKACTRCAESKTTDTHNYQPSDHKDETCTEDGYDEVKCTKCEDTIRTPISAHHIFEYDDSDKPTCTEDGSIITTCERCDYYDEETKEKLGHDEKVIYDAISHNKKCGRCGDNLTDPEEHIKEVDCETVRTEEGGYAVYTSRFFYKCIGLEGLCEYEEDITESEIKIPLVTDGGVLGFDYVYDVTDPTCTVDGTFIVRRSDNNEEITRTNIPAPGSHDIEEHEGKGETCEDEGWHPYETCKREGCDYTTYQKIDPKGHTHTKEVVSEATKRSNADCTNKATYWHTCTDCDDISDTSYFEYGETEDHNYTKETVSEATKKDAATCTSKATYWYSCTGCDDISDTAYFEHGEPKDHTYTKEEVSEETKKDDATCTSKATYWYSCTGCDDISDESYFEYGETEDHNYTKETVSEETKKDDATCTSKATYWHTCTDCDDISDESYFEYGETEDHTYTKKTVSEATKKDDATCTSKAKYWLSCADCDDISDEAYFEHGEPKDHTYTKKTVSEATKRSNADCENKATYWYRCTDCDDISSSLYFEDGGFGSHNYVSGTCSVCGNPEPTLPDTTETFTRVDASGAEDADGDYILFGSYPQSEVTDSTLKSTLTTLAGTLPTASESRNWTSYKYYIGNGYSGSHSNSTDYMWYQDIVHNGEKFRGVYFTSYRPWNTSTTSSNTNQDDNGYSTENVYWFKYDPIKWRILTEDSGKALILCEMLIDSQAYQNCYTYTNNNYYATDDNGNILADGNGNKIYANNYAYSTVRAWLNDNFYNTAFNSLQKELIQLTTVDNSAATTSSSTNQYACANTEDNIFLLSYQDILNTSYGFSSNSSDYDEARQKQTTDYAQCQGAYTYSGGSYDGNGWWWLRSPYYGYSDLARVVSYYGYADSSYSVYITNDGVCPALWINLGASEGPEAPTEETYTRVDASGAEDADGDYILFGSYPQSEVTDSTLKSTLTTLAGTLPTASESRNWTSYKYYVDGSNSTDYMWYQDIVHNGEKYRGVYFTSYRPYFTSYSSFADYTYQDNNGYSTENVYWFKYDPIKWRILTEDSGKALILCEMLIDSQEYYHSTSNRTEGGSTIYANNYEYSNIRKWLNDNFYNTAFNSLQKELIQLTTVDNSAASTGYSTNQYACANTEDNIFLLSYQDILNTSYGFSSNSSDYDEARQKQTTDYAQCQGAWTSTSSGYEGNGYWWLRSPSDNFSYDARAVYDDGYANYYYDVGSTDNGVCPALWIDLSTEEESTETYTRVDASGAEDADGDYILFGSYPQSEVTDSTLKSTLTTLAGTLPTASESRNWTSYEYYIGTGSMGSQSNSTDYMWYQDIVHNGEKYRGVYFTSYRPYGTSNSSSAGNTYQDDNGYSTENVYWFKYDPIKWRILTEDSGKALILCEMLIDSQEYYHSTSNRTEGSSTIYANNYEYSNIRKWLNDNFYNTAFNSLQKELIQLTTVDNSAASTTDANGNITQATNYACNNTEDYIFLLSEKEVTTSAYGFDVCNVSDEARQNQTTDYAQCQGAYTYSGGSYDGNGLWWLRSPGSGSSYFARGVDYYGSADNFSNVNYTFGVCPALWINLGASEGPEAPTEETYTRVDASGAEDADGDYILFGSYPQSEVTDSALSSTLTTLAGTLPTASESQNWTSYEYYIGTVSTGSQSNSTDYMWYQDIVHNGEKYRGVYFTSYRPSWTSGSSSTGNSVQDDNGYSTENVYWFKYDPIKWRILTEDSGKALILCEMLIDSQAYQNCYTYTSSNYYATDDNGNILTDGNGNKIYANNYAYSTVREWLNDNFYNTAFNSLQKELIQLTTVDNSAASTTDANGNITQATNYACNNTEDYIFLLSEKEVTTSAYGFDVYNTIDEARQKQTTDYAQCQGAYTESGGSYDGNGWWWLRSPLDNLSNRARFVSSLGDADRNNSVTYTKLGVCPALWISFE